MDTTVADLHPKTLENAKRQFVELYGSALVMNTYLKIALLLVSLLALGLLALNFHTVSKYARVRPLVVRIDGVVLEVDPETGAMDPAKCCVTCSGCTQIMRDGGQTGCVVRDSAIYDVPVWRDLPLTWYTRHGDVFAEGCTVVAVLAWAWVLVGWWRRKQARLSVGPR